MATQAEKTAARIVKDAKAHAGHGWYMVSEDVRWGLVAARVLALFLAQDESIDPARARELTEQVTAAALKLVYSD